MHIQKCKSSIGTGDPIQIVIVAKFICESKSEEAKRKSLIFLLHTNLTHQSQQQRRPGDSIMNTTGRTIIKHRKEEPTLTVPRQQESSKSSDSSSDA